MIPNVHFCKIERTLTYNEFVEDLSRFFFKIAVKAKIVKNLVKDIVTNTKKKLFRINLDNKFLPFIK